MRVAVIGLGSIGTRHVKNLIALGHDVTGHDNRNEALWLGEACRLARTFSDLMHSQPEAVLICTPASTHATVAKQLLTAGYQSALFVEKPLALCVEDAEVFKTWPYPTTMVGYNLRFHHKVRRMREEIPSPTKGLFSLHCDMRTWPGTYAEPVLECSHELDLALWCGAPTTVSKVSQVEHRARLELGPWTVDLDWQTHSGFRRWAISDGRRAAQYTFGSPDDLGTKMYHYEVAHFLDCAQRGIATSTPFADGIRVLDVVAQGESLVRQNA